MYSKADLGGGQLGSFDLNRVHQARPRAHLIAASIGASIAVCVCVIAATACTSDQTSSQQDRSPSAPTPTVVTEPTSQPNDARPDPAEQAEVYETVDGATLTSSEIAGRDVVLWFWAPWCEPCADGAADMQAAFERYGQDVAFVGVAARDRRAEMVDFVENHDLEFPQIADIDQRLWKQWGVVTQPTTVFLGSDGQAVTLVGSLSEATIAARIDEMRSR